jgi:hypothetical protein
MDQLTAAEAHYTAMLKRQVEDDVPTHAPPPAEEPPAAPFAESSSATGADFRTPVNDPAGKDRAIVRALALGWGLPEPEIDHVLSHHRDPEKARNILWQAKQRRQSTPDPQPTLTAAAAD